MSPRTTTKLEWSLVSASLRDAMTDFFLSRVAMRVAPATLTFYRNTSGRFLAWAEKQGITSPDGVTARIVRQYLADLADRGKADGTIRDHARAIKTLTRFWEAEGYITQPVKFSIPRVADKRLPVLDASQVQRIIRACNVRDKALILTAIDTGLRRAELVALNWLDVDFQTGIIAVRRGKGGRSRTVVIGATARRALLGYRRQLEDAEPVTPLFRGPGGRRLTGSGVLQIVRRLSKRTRIPCTVHGLRRTFALLSLRGGMDVLSLQRLLGHADLTMTQHYVSLLDADLVRAHEQHSPIDNLDKLA